MEVGGWVQVSLGGGGDWKIVPKLIALYQYWYLF